MTLLGSPVTLSRVPSQIDRFALAATTNRQANADGTAGGEMHRL